MNVVLFVIDKNESQQANPIKNYYANRINNSVANPYMPDSFKNSIRGIFSSGKQIKHVQKQIKIWLIVSDVLLALVFIFIILGFSTTSAPLSFIEGCLHFIGTVLISNTMLQPASSDYIICGVFFGVMAPFLLEIWEIFCLLCLKTDFY